MTTEKFNMQFVLWTMCILIVTGYMAITTLRHMTYAKAYITEPNLIDTLPGEEIYVSLGDFYDTKEQLPYVVVAHEENKQIDRVLRINKNLIYRVEPYNSVRMDFIEHIRLRFR